MQGHGHRAKNRSLDERYSLDVVTMQNTIRSFTYNIEDISDATVRQMYAKIANRFETKELIMLHKNSTIDYLSLESTLRNEGLYVSMQEYSKTVVALCLATRWFSAKHTLTRKSRG